LDNLTHSLVGAAIADLARRQPGQISRPLLVGAGVIAANLPDVDIVYSHITPPPIGYLLHHRGHTHTVLGLGALAILLMAASRSVPFVRSLPQRETVRLWSVIGAGLASHLLLDALNSYGIHPFHPFDSTWYFGDAIFILEPSLWLVLGVAVARNARSSTAQLAVALPLLVLLATIASTGVIPSEALATLVTGGLVFTWMARNMTPGARSAVALAVTIAIGIGMMGVSRYARATAAAALQPHLRGRLVDVIMTPNPSSPSCWSVIGVELHEPAGVYRLWRGTLSLAPKWKPPIQCASHAVLQLPPGARVLGDGAFVLRDVVDQSLVRLRELSRHDCWAHAWLRFGRAPVIDREQLFDLRFADRPTRNFSHMPLNREPEDRACPDFVPRWNMPRTDLLVPGHNHPE
jgi:inner membrane protein